MKPLTLESMEHTVGGASCDNVAKAAFIVGLATVSVALLGFAFSGGNPLGAAAGAIAGIALGVIICRVSS